MDRRLFLSLTAGWASLPKRALAQTDPPRLRRLRLVNAHTGENFEGAYRDDNGPIPRVIRELCVFLRDFHADAVTEMDVGVIDFLADVLDAVGETKATILSAYRTAGTNAMLARTMFGVAEHSQHIRGRALDFCLGSKLAGAMQAARAMRRGGVGWYPNSGFMHIDTGPVRNWTLDQRRLDDQLGFASRPRRAAGEMPHRGGGLARPAASAGQHTTDYQRDRAQFLARLGRRDD